MLIPLFSMVLLGRAMQICSHKVGLVRLTCAATQQARLTAIQPQCLMGQTDSHTASVSHKVSDVYHLVSTHPGADRGPTVLKICFIFVTVPLCSI